MPIPITSTIHEYGNAFENKSSVVAMRTMERKDDEWVKLSEDGPWGGTRGEKRKLESGAPLEAKRW